MFQCIKYEDKPILYYSILSMIEFVVSNKMLHENDMKNVWELFHYIMITAKLLEAKLYYANIKQLLDAELIERVKEDTITGLRIAEKVKL